MQHPSTIPHTCLRKAQQSIDALFDAVPHAFFLHSPLSPELAIEHEYTTINLDPHDIGDTLGTHDTEAVIRMYTPRTRSPLFDEVPLEKARDTLLALGTHLIHQIQNGMRTTGMVLVQIDTSLARWYTHVMERVHKAMLHTPPTLSPEASHYVARSAPAPSNLPCADVPPTLSIVSINTSIGRGERENITIDHTSLTFLVLKRIYRVLRYGHHPSSVG